ncbi:MAG: universal stress protein [Bacteroidales bacterium]|nr:universal stress protein [Bacteroidales bacterium]
MNSSADQKSGQEQVRKVTVALHTREHAERLCRLLEHEGVVTELVAARLGQKLTEHPIEVRIKEDDIPAALRIIENIEIFPLYAENQNSGTQAAHDNNGTVGERSSGNVVKRIGLRRKVVINRIPTGKTILVPVDFSDYSFTATRLAFEMASAHDAQIVLLYAYVTPSRADSLSISPDSGLPDISDEEAVMELGRLANKRMDEFAERVKEYIKTGVIPAVKFVTEVFDGLAEEVILEYARSTSPMMIVMGTRGAGKKESEMVGSVTAEVLDSCRSVAFTVPETMRLPIPMDGMRQVTFFANLDHDDFSVLEKVYELFPLSPFAINLVYAGRKRVRNSVEWNEQQMEMLLDYCKIHYPGYQFELTRVGGISDIEDFEKLQQERPAEMIIIPNKRKNALARLFNPSIAHRLLFHCDIPMLVVPV